MRPAFPRKFLTGVAARTSRAANRIRRLDLFLVVAPIVVLAAVSASLRFYCLGCRSLWLDEVATTNVLMYPSLGDAISYAGSWTDHTASFSPDLASGATGTG